MAFHGVLLAQPRHETGAELQMKGWGLRHLAQIQPCSAGGAGADSPLLTPPLEQEGWENLLETIQDMIVLDTPGLCRELSQE